MTIYNLTHAAPKASGEGGVISYQLFGIENYRCCTVPAMPAVRRM